METEDSALNSTADGKIMAIVWLRLLKNCAIVNTWKFREVWVLILLILTIQLEMLLRFNKFYTLTASETNNNTSYAKGFL